MRQLTDHIVSGEQAVQLHMYMEPPTGNEGFPTAIYVEMASFDRAPTWAPNWRPYPNSGIIFDRYHREWNGLSPWMDSSYGPPMPVHRDIWGTDNTKLR